jgi:hypothetical protein
MTTSDGVSSSGLYGFKNRIINGAMVIDQRNAGASVTPTSGTDTYVIDRFSVYVSQASKLTAQQNAGSVTPPAGYTNYFGITSSSAYSITSTDWFSIRQAIEGFNVADLAWGTASAATVTLSFWVRSSLTGTFGGSLRNNAASRSYPFTYTISSANTWTQISVVIAGDTSGAWTTNNTAGISIFWGLGVGSTNSGTAGAWASASYGSATGATSVVGTNGATFYITGVQLEKGSVATSFDYRPYGTELALCQRYLPAFTGANGATAGSIGTGGFYDTTNAAIGIPFPVPTRVAPTGITVASAGYFQIDGLTSAACSSAAFSNASQNMGGVNFGYSTITTAGSFGRLRFNNASGTLLFTGCEL